MALSQTAARVMQVCSPCLSGDKFICLAITEPYAGSDVAAIRSTAVKDPTGAFLN